MEAEAVKPFLSVTVTVTEYVPAVAYTWEGSAPAPVEPSPKFQAYVKLAASSGLTSAPVAAKLVAQSALPEKELATVTVGGTGSTAKFVLAVAVAPAEVVTVSVIT